jgi:localization factor PodJL
MTSGGPWNLRGLRPQTIAAAREAARRSGVSVGEWLNDLIEQDDHNRRAEMRSAAYSEQDYGWPEDRLDSQTGVHAYSRGSRPRPPRPDYVHGHGSWLASGFARESILTPGELENVHARLDHLTDHLERLVRGAAPMRGAPTQPPHGRWHRPWPRSGNPASDNGFADRASVAADALEPDLPSSGTVPHAAEASEPQLPLEFPELEDQLRRITAQIESLRSTDLDKVIGAFRSDLAEIRRQLTEALPRQAVESLCVEVEALAGRIDRSRECAGDSDAIAGIEHGLAEVRDALRGMTTAENLVGFDEALRALTQKLDLIIAREDPTALRQLETAIGALRGVVSHVASNDALNKVAEDVRNLAAKIDSLAKGAASGQVVSALGNRIDTLTNALNASAEAGYGAPRDLEKLLSSLIEKLEWIRLNATDPSVFKRLEDRIAQLISRLDASDARLGNLAGIERSLADLLTYIETLRGADAAPAADTSSRPNAVAAIAHDVAEIKRSERRTQDSLEAVHDTVEQVVGRLAMIESDINEAAMRSPRSQGLAPAAADKAAVDRAISEPAGLPSQSFEASEGPAASNGTGRSQAGAAPADLIAEADRQDFIAAARRATQAAAAANEIEMRSSSRRRRRRRTYELGEAQGNRPSRLRKLLVAAAIVLITAGCLQIALHVFQDRQVGRDATLPHSLAPAVIPETNNTPAIAPAAPNSNPKSDPKSNPKSDPKSESGSQAPPESAPAPSAPSATGPLVLPSSGAASDPADGSGAPIVAPNAAPATAPNREPAAAPSAAPPAVAPNAIWSAPSAPAAQDPTGSVPPSAAPPPAAPPSANTAAMSTLAPDAAIDILPATIGGPALRAAAMAGDAAAQFEVAVRFAEGRGVARNDRQAAHWLELAAKQGLAPAQFRLGGYYEKGIGVKKDLAAARDLYLAAAAKGNGKAMHNVAVLYADGVNGRSDYHSAALWFRKAADHGITDSQYNLAILYARGNGEPQNYAEAYKWFALAAKQGDVEAASKRDEVASQLDDDTLAAADFVVKGWRPEPQPDEAIKVKAPPGGWDAVAQPKAKPRTTSAKLAGPDSRTN